MPQIPTREYLRRRQLTLRELMNHAEWWDFPSDYKGYAEVTIGGKVVRIDMCKGSVPCVIRRPYFPC